MVVLLVDHEIFAWKSTWKKVLTFTERRVILVNMKKINHSMFLLIFVSLTASAQPDWIKDTKRRVIGGDIIHWGTGLADTPEVALFMARHMAIKAIIEECGGFAHKDIVPKQRHVESKGKRYKAFAKVFIPFDSCAYGKKPYANSNMENEKIVASQRFYSRLIGDIDQNEREFLEEWVKDENNRLWSNVKSEQDSTQEQINALQQEIQRMKDSVHLQNRPVAPVYVPVKSGMKVLCWKEYQTLMDQAMMDAAPYGARLNHPKALPMFNAAQRKKQICIRMK